MSYQPSPLILEKYANILVNFALGSGKGIKKGEVVQLVIPEVAKPLMIEIRKAILRSGGHIILTYLPDDEDRFNTSRDFCELASQEQLEYYPKKYLTGLIEEVDHILFILAETNKHALDGIDPQKILSHHKSLKPYWDIRHKKDLENKLTWTIGLFGTEAMAKEVDLSYEEYWQQIIDACYLNDPDPIASWKRTYMQIDHYAKKLNQLGNCKLHIEGDDSDLWITIGEHRNWKSGGGANIPSFEIFTSPDWRGTDGWIRFNQPLYYMSHLITGIYLEFEKGHVVKATASKNEKLLKEMIAQVNADKIGEFSLTDGRFSKITKFMGETLYDENIGGEQGNTHLALGHSYQDTYSGDYTLLHEQNWEQLGYNSSIVHTDIMSTTKRTVIAHFDDGTTKVIYDSGQFVL